MEEVDRKKELILEEQKNGGNEEKEEKKADSRGRGAGFARRLKKTDKRKNF